jgi:transposase InsO family protein
MPWQETDPMIERRHFIQDAKSGQWAMSELCLRYGVSRVTGYKWLERHQQGGDGCLVDRSRAPLSSPSATAPELVKLILEENSRYGWGARKIRRRLSLRHPDKGWPARSTIADILWRNGRVRPRRLRTRWKHPGAAPFSTTAPNQVWTVDFKGQFRMRDGRYCYPLTVVDHFSRYLLCCHGLLDVRTAGVIVQFRRLFREHGLPFAIRSDNGAPFASTGIHGLTQLNVWWLQLGITHQRITPGRPQQNAAHERMHRSLKQRLPRPPAANLNLQQRVFNTFRRTYNHIRPHEALNDDTPASHWKPSRRRYPERIVTPRYPPHVELRRVSNAGCFRLHSGQQFLSQALNGETIGLEQIDDALWNILYYDTLLGRYDEHNRRITGVPALRQKC